MTNMPSAVKIPSVQKPYKKLRLRCFSHFIRASKHRRATLGTQIVMTQQTTKAENRLLQGVYCGMFLEFKGGSRRPVSASAALIPSTAEDTIPPE